MQIASGWACSSFFSNKKPQFLLLALLTHFSLLELVQTKHNNLKACSIEMENLSPDQRKAIEELVQGREFANQLRDLINNGDDGSSAAPFAEDLVGRVLRSFTNTLLLLNNHPKYESDEVSQMQLKDSSCLVPAKSEDSEESCKSSTIKDRRGCYKRRRTSQTWERESEAPIDDGHAWRKYGQKTILNAKYPRNYYRCTHKYDQNCQATKQVQRIQKEPPLYRTTYYGQHTCRDLLNPEIILDSDARSDSSMFLSFDNTFPTNQDHPFFSSSIKGECKQEVSSSSLEDYQFSPEITLDPSRHVTLSSTLESEYRDVISGVFCDSFELDGVFETFQF